MNFIKATIGFAVAVILVGGVAVTAYKVTVGNDSVSLGNTRICTITQNVVSVGHQLSTQILSAGSRQWAIIQQPVNATNTVAISFSGSATLGSGYHLYPPVSASTTDYLKIGFATDVPTSASLQAITSTGSSTLKVIECK